MTKEETSKEKPCNHFMVWNIQGGYSYYSCDRCNYIDGKKTFEAQKQDLLEKIKEINVGTLGGSIIISRKDLKQLLK